MPVADGRKNNGGARPGAGRKPAEVRDELTRLLDQAVPTSDRLAILSAMSQKAQEGDIKAATLMLAYLYGRPVERQEITTDQQPQPIKITVQYQDAAPQSADGDE